ncbi:MAG: hypothetical protein LBS59_06020 [Puniceicoccales bacterium]|nr:hypothetical protein [Puniceicoccales bacterium]
MKHFSSSTVSRTIAARFGLTAAIATATGALNLAPVALVAPDDRRAVDRRITSGWKQS